MTSEVPNPMELRGVEFQKTVSTFRTLEDIFYKCILEWKGLREVSITILPMYIRELKCIIPYTRMQNRKLQLLVIISLKLPDFAN